MITNEFLLKFEYWNQFFLHIAYWIIGVLLCIAALEWIAVLILWSLAKSRKFQGWNGERLTEQELKWINRFGWEGQILRNVYIPKENGETSEIDLLYVTQKGIFVIESKNIDGWVYGKEDERFWTVCLPKRKKYRMPNPVLQNRGHVVCLGKYLRRTLSVECPMFSLIVFSERCFLKRITVESSSVQILNRDLLYDSVRYVWDSSPDVMDEETVSRITSDLIAYTKVNRAKKKKHIDQINQKLKSGAEKNKRVFHNDETTTSIEEEESLQPQARIFRKEPQTADGVRNGAVQRDLTCPRCGAPLVPKIARQGNYAGNQFYGCSNYPKCRYLINFDEFLQSGAQN